MHGRPGVLPVQYTAGPEGRTRHRRQSALTLAASWERPGFHRQWRWRLFRWYRRWCPVPSSPASEKTAPTTATVRGTTAEPLDTRWRSCPRLHSVYNISALLVSALSCRHDTINILIHLINEHFLIMNQANIFRQVIGVLFLAVRGWERGHSKAITIKISSFTVYKCSPPPSYCILISDVLSGTLKNWLLKGKSRRSTLDIRPDLLDKESRNMLQNNSSKRRSWTCKDTYLTE